MMRVGVGVWNGRKFRDVGRREAWSGIEVEGLGFEDAERGEFSTRGGEVFDWTRMICSGFEERVFGIWRELGVGWFEILGSE